MLFCIVVGNKGPLGVLDYYIEVNSCYEVHTYIDISHLVSFTHSVKLRTLWVLVPYWNIKKHRMLLGAFLCWWAIRDSNP